MFQRRRRCWIAALGAPLRCVRNIQGRGNVSRAEEAGNLAAGRQAGRQRAKSDDDDAAADDEQRPMRPPADLGATKFAVPNRSDAAGKRDSAKIAAGVQHGEPWKQGKAQQQQDSTKPKLQAIQ